MSGPLHLCECDTPSKYRILETNRLREQRHYKGLIKLNMMQIVEF